MAGWTIGQRPCNSFQVVYKFFSTKTTFMRFISFIVFFFIALNANIRILFEITRLYPHIIGKFNDSSTVTTFVSFVSILPGFTFPFLLHTTQDSCNNMIYCYLRQCNTPSYTTLTLHDTTLEIEKREWTAFVIIVVQPRDV